MARIAFRPILPRTTLPSNAGTYPVKITRSMLLNALVIYVEWTNGATSCKDQSVYDEIDRVELIANGSRVLYSLTGQEARLWSHVFLKQQPKYVRDENAAGVQSAYIYMPFGLTPDDKMHYLDTAQFNDLELRITYSPTIAATSFATGTGAITIFGRVWTEGSPGPSSGFCRITQQSSFTSAATGDVPIELPIGEKYLAIGIYNFETGVSPETDISTIELDVNDHEFWLAQGAWNDLNQWYSHELGINGEQSGIIFKSDTDTLETWTGDCLDVSLQPLQTLNIGVTDYARYNVSTIAGGLVTLQSVTVDAAAVAAEAANVTDEPVRWSARPLFGLGNFLVIPFGFPNLPENVFNSNQYKRVRLTLTQAGAGAAVMVSLLELVNK